MIIMVMMTMTTTTTTTMMMMMMIIIIIICGWQITRRDDTIQQLEEDLETTRKQLKDAIEEVNFQSRRAVVQISEFIWWSTAISTEVKLAFGFKPTPLLIHISYSLQKGRLEAKVQAYKISTQSEQDVLAEEVCCFSSFLSLRAFLQTCNKLTFGSLQSPPLSTSFLLSRSRFPFPVNKLNSNALLFQVAKREEAIHKLKIEKLALQEQQQKAEDNVNIWFL